MKPRARSGVGPGGKILFANQLRALAALCVVLSHLGGVFILMGPTVGWVTSSPELHVGRPAILQLTSWSWLNLGAFGVAVFFLISGFVIPFSLRAQPAGPFLVARAFRIFPTLWAAILIDWLTVHAQSVYYGRAMAFTPFTYLYNALLLDTAVGHGYVDLVNWTLAIEVKFYIVMALLRPWILRGRVLPLLGFSLLAIAIAAGKQHGFIHIVEALSDEPMYVGFMLIGILFHYHLTGLIRPAKAVATGAILLAFFLLCWRLGPIRNQYPVISVNYLYALLLFWACYLGRGMFRKRRWLDFLAGISFPLYLTHSIVGYSALTFLIARCGFSYASALPAALVLVATLAWLLHRLVELPSMGFGKSLAGSLGGRKAGAAAMLPGSGG